MLVLQQPSGALWVCQIDPGENWPALVDTIAGHPEDCGCDLLFVLKTPRKERQLAFSLLLLDAECESVVLSSGVIDLLIKPHLFCDVAKP